MRLHVVSVPWSETIDEFSWCGHTAMTARFATMCHRQGHEVLLYAGERNEAECKEHIELITRQEQADWFSNLNNSLHAVPGLWHPTSPWWKASNERAAAAILERTQPHDLVCVIGGDAQQSLGQLPLKVVEWGVGYLGPFANYRCYPSNAWRHYISGKQGLLNGRYYDAVIPHFFDPDDFYVAPNKQDYLLFLGRVHESKGAHVANDIARWTGRQLVVAGPGDPALCPDGDYRGVVTTVERAKLLAEAHAVVAPSQYLEPFGNVAVEAQLSGTPVITPDWGAFPETVLPGSGYRCNTFREFCAAVDGPTYSPATIRKKALAKYSLDAVGPQFDTWFDRLATLDGAGWYA